MRFIFVLGLAVARAAEAFWTEESGGAFGRGPSWVDQDDGAAAFRELFEVIELSMSLSMSYPPLATPAPTTLIASHPPVVEPEEPDTLEPETEVPETEEPATRDPSSKVPSTVEPQTLDPEKTEDPKKPGPPTEAPETEEPETEEPETEEPETEEPETVEPEDQDSNDGQMTASCDTLPSSDLLVFLEVETSQQGGSLLDALGSQISTALQNDYSFCGDILAAGRRLEGDVLIGDLELLEQGACQAETDGNGCVVVRLLVPLFGDTSTATRVGVVNTIEAALASPLVQDELSQEGIEDVRLQVSEATVSSPSVAAAAAALALVALSVVAVAVGRNTLVTSGVEEKSDGLETVAGETIISLYTEVGDV